MDVSSFVGNLVILFVSFYAVKWLAAKLIVRPIYAVGGWIRDHVDPPTALRLGVLAFRQLPEERRNQVKGWAEPVLKTLIPQLTEIVIAEIKASTVKPSVPFVSPPTPPPSPAVPRAEKSDVPPTQQSEGAGAEGGKSPLAERRAVFSPSYDFSTQGSGTSTGSISVVPPAAAVFAAGGSGGAHWTIT